MSAKLHLGVQKWLNGESIGGHSSGQASGVFAKIVPEKGRGKAIEALVPIGAAGNTCIVEVPAGRLSVEVRLPSGEMLLGNVEVGEEADKELVLRSRQSPHEWLSWARMLIPMSAAPKQQERPNDKLDKLGLHLWIRDPQGVIQRREGRLWEQDDGPDVSIVSCTFYDPPRIAGLPPPALGERTYLAVDVEGPDRLLATVPIPWAGPNCPTRVQILLKLSHEGEESPAGDVKIDAVVHDRRLSMMLGYLHSGDLAAARAFEVSVRDDAQRMLHDKVANPIAAAAGGYLLLQTRALEQMHDWPRNLAIRFPWLPDGAILHATQQLRSRSPVRNVEEARKWLLIAATRGAPVFTEGVRLLGEGMRMLAKWEDLKSARRARASDAEEAFAQWVEKLESSTRPDSLFTVLEADEDTLESLVTGLK